MGLQYLVRCSRLASRGRCASTRAGVRVTSYRRDNYTPGWKYNFWELRVGGCAGFEALRADLHGSWQCARMHELCTCGNEVLVTHSLCRGSAAPTRACLPASLGTLFRLFGLRLRCWPG